MCKQNLKAPYLEDCVVRGRTGVLVSVDELVMDNKHVLLFADNLQTGDWGSTICLERQLHRRKGKITLRIRERNYRS